MRLGLVLDFSYLLSSLWGTSVCTSARSATTERTEITPTSMRQRPNIVAFVDVNVVPMDTERVLTHQTVLVEGGRITAMGPMSEVTIPSGGLRIDSRGKYLMPGLADMHVHNDAGSVTYDHIAPNLFVYLTGGVTAIRYLNAVSGDPQRFENPAVASPHVYIRAFATLGAWGGIASLDTATGGGSKDDVRSSQNPRKRLTDDSLAFHAAAAKAAGYDFIRLNASDVHGRKKLPGVDSLLSAAQQVGLPLATHSHEGSFTETLALGAYGGSSDHLRSFWDTLGLSNGYWERDTLGAEELDAAIQKIPVFAAAVQRAGTWITPTLDCIEGKYNPSSAKLVILRRMVKALQDAGVRMLLSGDDGKDVHHELAALVRAGLSPYQALLTGTRHAAQYMGLADESGTVAVGKRADLILLASNPLADVRHAREPLGVMIDGRWLDRAALDQRLLALPLAKSWPRFWLRLDKKEMALTKGAVVLGRILGPGGVDPNTQQRQQLEPHVQRFEALSDSLALMRSAKQETGSVSLQMQQLAEALGAMREVLTPEQRAAFDPKIRMWLRQQGRKGFTVSVRGVARSP